MVWTVLARACVSDVSHYLGRTEVNIEPGQIGKWLIVVGAVTIVVGLLLLLLGRLGLFRLPGDLQFEGRNWRIYLPLASCILISIILTLIMWIIRYLRR
jgi:hypothetical protein